MSFEIKIDLEHDVRSHLIGQMRQMGYSYKDEGDLLDVATDFQMLLQRTLLVAPRTLLCAGELVVPSHLKKGFDAFSNAVNKGHDLRPYQSRTIKKEQYRDLMLIDWGIQHFHVGTSVEADGFVDRCDPLLFALVTESQVCCIGFWGHGQWTDTEVIGIVHDNWPELIRRHRIEGIVGLAHSYSSDDIKKLRKAQINAAFEPRPGAFYFPPGGGQVASGHSMPAVLRATHLQKIVTRLTRASLEQISALGELKSDITLRAHFTHLDLEVRDQLGNLIAAVKL